MWQLRKLSTNEALSEAGPLPNNWGPIFGLHGFLDKIGDMSWAGSYYADKGWIELTEAEEKEVLTSQALQRINQEKKAANTALSSPEITVEQKSAWLNYLLALDLVSLQADFPFALRIPASPRPSA